MFAVWTNILNQHRTTIFCGVRAPYFIRLAFPDTAILRLLQTLLQPPSRTADNLSASGLLLELVRQRYEHPAQAFEFCQVPYFAQYRDGGAGAQGEGGEYQVEGNFGDEPAARFRPLQGVLRFEVLLREACQGLPCGRVVPDEVEQGLDIGPLLPAEAARVESEGFDEFPELAFGQLFGEPFGEAALIAVAPGFPGRAQGVIEMLGAQVAPLLQAAEDAPEGLARAFAEGGVHRHGFAEQALLLELGLSLGPLLALGLQDALEFIGQRFSLGCERIGLQRCSKTDVDSPGIQAVDLGLALGVELSRVDRAAAVFEAVGVAVGRLAVGLQQAEADPVAGRFDRGGLGVDTLPLAQ